MCKSEIAPDGEAATLKVGDAVGVSKRKWFVAQVGQNTEKATRDRLQKLGYEAFVASQEEIRTWSNGKRKKIEVVKITTMVFVRVTEAERRIIVNLPFINRFMVNRTMIGPNGFHPVAVIPDAQMELLKFMLFKADHPVHFVSTLAKGDRVRVMRGSMQGFEGQIVTMCGSADKYIGINLGFLGCAVTRIPMSDVMKIA